MQMKITKIGAHKGALIISIIASLVTLLISLLVGLLRVIFAASDLFELESVFTSFFVFMYALAWGIGTYIVVFVCLSIYNRISPIVGCIEFEIDKSDL